MESTLQYSSIEKGIAKVYIVLLPLRMILPFSLITEVFSAASTYFDFVLHLLGMFFLVFGHGGKIKSTKLANSFATTILYLLGSSVVMALLLNKTLGTLDGENSISAITGPTIYYLQYILIVFYNINIFHMFTVGEIDRLIQRSVKWLLVLGYAQIVVCIGPNFLGKIYDALNFLGAFQPTEYLLDVGRIPLAGSEPAAGGWMIGLLVFPYLLSKIMTERHKKNYISQLLLWLPVVYFSKSTTCYVLVACACMVYLLLDIKYNRRARTMRIVALPLLLIVIVFLIVLWDIPNESSFLSDIRYLLFEKATDEDNQSTVTRTIPTYINFKIFLRYPIFGVGNGNQGFFYREFFPEWGDITKYVFDDIVGVADGGVFVPSLFSGFGIVGVVIFTIYAVKHVQLAIRWKEKLGALYYMFVIAGAGFIVNGFQGDYFGQYLPMFVMCIPFMGSCCQRSTDDEVIYNATEKNTDSDHYSNT